MKTEEAIDIIHVEWTPDHPQADHPICDLYVVKKFVLANLCKKGSTEETLN